MSYPFEEEEDRLIQYDRQYFGEELRSREFLEFGLKSSVATISRPMVTMTMVLEREEWAIKWMGDKQLERPGFLTPQAVYLFPIIPPQIPELEFTHPHEWDIQFIGTVEGLVGSRYALYFNIPEGMEQDRWFAVMKPNHILHGNEGQSMHMIYYTAEIICRIVSGVWVDSPEPSMHPGEHLVFPKQYQLEW